ncbi:MAG TPA: glycosyltransferase family 39 protein [Gemmatimonadaceae bacterium]
MPRERRASIDEFLSNHDRAAAWVVTAIAILVAASRAWQARESLWLDELHTAWAAGGALSQVAHRSEIGNQSPLFFWVEWFITRFLGASELTLRLPSIVAATAMPVALFATVRKWTGSPWLALLPGWLYAVDPQAIYFGTEARPYALIQLLAVLHVMVFAAAVERPSAGKRVTLVAGMAALFYLNYTAVLLLGAEIVFWLVWRRGHRDASHNWNPFALDAGALTLVSLGALPTLREIAARRDNWASFVTQRPLWQGMLMAPWAWTAVALVVLVTAVRRFTPATPANASRSRALALTMAWLGVPVLIAWTATETDVARLLHPRYLAAAAPAAVVLIALAVSMVPWTRARIGISMALVIVAPVLGRFPAELRSHGRLISYREDDWRAAIAAFNRTAGHERDPVLVRSLLIESDGLSAPPDSSLAAYCLYPVTSLYRLDADPNRLIALQRTNAVQLSAANARRVILAPGFWMVLNASGDQADLIEDQFTRIGASSVAPSAAGRWVVTKREVFGSVRVLRFDRAP